MAKGQRSQICTLLVRKPALWPNQNRRWPRRQRRALDLGLDLHLFMRSRLIGKEQSAPLGPITHNLREGFEIIHLRHIRGFALLSGLKGMGL
jgi:hypothetical protein